MSDLISKKDVIAKSHDIVLGEYRHRCVDAGVIMLMPEVDAIPVDWVKKWIFEHPYFHVASSTLLDDWQKDRRKEE